MDLGSTSEPKNRDDELKRGIRSSKARCQRLAVSCCLRAVLNLDFRDSTAAASQIGSYQNENISNRQKAHTRGGLKDRKWEAVFGGIAPPPCHPQEVNRGTCHLQVTTPRLPEIIWAKQVGTLSIGMACPSAVSVASSVEHVTQVLDQQAQMPNNTVFEYSCLGTKHTGLTRVPPS